MNKELKPIPLAGYEDYGIDKDGDVYSYKKHEGVKKRITGTCEYYITTLYINHKKAHKTNHRLCAIAGLPLPDGSKEYSKGVVCHKDNNKLNNNINNLYWGKPRENTKQMYDDGIWDVKNARKYRNKHRNYLVYISGELVGVFHSYKEIIDTFGIPNTTIYRLIKNKTAYNKYDARIEVIEPE